MDQSTVECWAFVNVVWVCRHCNVPTVYKTICGDSSDMSVLCHSCMLSHVACRGINMMSQWLHYLKSETTVIIEHEHHVVVLFS